MPVILGKREKRFLMSEDLEYIVGILGPKGEKNKILGSLG